MQYKKNDRVAVRTFSIKSTPFIIEFPKPGEEGETKLMSGVKLAKVIGKLENTDNYVIEFDSNNCHKELRVVKLGDLIPILD